MLNLLFFWFRRKHPKRSSRHQQSFPVHWVIPYRLAVGRLPRKADMDELARSNIQAVLALCSESEGQWPINLEQRFQCHRIVIPDSHYATPLKPHQIETAVDYLHECIQRQLPVFVHCLAGIERSPTICIAYLCRYHNYTLWESLDWVRRVHPDSLPTDKQIQSIRGYLSRRAQRIA
ncbi:MAG: dual specificity protein phosphatase [Cyanobacteria bacterium J06633_2]